MLNALVLVVFFSFVPIVLGLAMTGLLARHRRPGMGASGFLFLLPQVIPLVAVGVTWRWLYGDDGLVNQMFRAVGLDGVTRAWLGDFDAALIAVGLVGTWVMSGLCMMLFLSGVQKIDPQPLRGGPDRRGGPGAGVLSRSPCPSCAVSSPSP